MRLNYEKYESIIKIKLVIKLVPLQRRKRISFVAKQNATKPVKVKFKTTTGKRISFKATKPITKKVKVSFLAKKKKKK